MPATRAARRGVRPAPAAQRDLPPSAGPRSRRAAQGPRVLLLRGLALLRAEPAVLRRQTGLGAEAARGRDVLRRVAGLLAAGHPPQTG
ncbi:hypothetical protein [Verrucosispora sioxanthis]|uniref:hypothetical protein n=1 Tax=Verrucosispora sioxanthis TaxID=2499994 RepID=UPI001F2AF9FA|nr:hypothetical protein [Verrucosispora sioxanthis]